MAKQWLFGQTVVDADGVSRLANVESNGDGTGRARLPYEWVKVKRDLFDWCVVKGDDETDNRY
jgi:hypothetical protein